MSIQLVQDTLPNGLRVLVWPMRETYTARINLVFLAGSRCEARETSGIAHFLEHMAFRGGRTYATQAEVSETLEGWCGGRFNAFTNENFIAFTMDVAAENLELAFDVLSDMVIHAKLEPDDIEQERNAVLHEFAGFEDSPDEVAWYNFQRLFFGDSPLGWGTLGTKENLRRFEQRDFIAYRNQFFNAHRAMLCVAGRVDPEKTFAWSSQYFGDLSGWKPRTVYPWKPAVVQAEPKAAFEKKASAAQTHLGIGVLAPTRGDNYYAARELLTTILGRGLSSRFFQNVRSRLGLAYTISSNYSLGSDHALLSTYAAIEGEKLSEAVQAIREGYERIACEAPSLKEVERARKFLSAARAMTFEKPEAISAVLPQFTLLYGYTKLPDELVHEFDEVTPEDIQKAAAEIFTPGALRLSVVGPGDYTEEQLLKLLS